MRNTRKSNKLAINMSKKLTVQNLRIYLQQCNILGSLHSTMRHNLKTTGLNSYFTVLYLNTLLLLLPSFPSHSLCKHADSRHQNLCG